MFIFGCCCSTYQANLFNFKYKQESWVNTATRYTRITAFLYSASSSYYFLYILILQRIHQTYWKIVNFVNILTRVCTFWRIYCWEHFDVDLRSLKHRWTMVLYKLNHVAIFRQSKLFNQIHTIPNENWIPQIEYKNVN